MIRGLKKGLAGVLLLVGLPVCALAIAKLPNKNLTPADRHEVTLALVLFGVVPTATAGYLIWDLRWQFELDQRDRLQSTFFELVKAGDGVISVLDFAIAAQISGDLARSFLDQRAQEFNATFEVSETGGIFYQFPLAATNRLNLQAAESTYDVILEWVPSAHKREITRILQKLTGEDWKSVKAIVKKAPIAVTTGVDRNTAESFRSRLEAAGAKVTLSLN